MTDCEKLEALVFAPWTADHHPAYQRGFADGRKAANAQLIAALEVAKHHVARAPGKGADAAYAQICAAIAAAKGEV